jgi:hypothetical protein
MKYILLGATLVVSCSFAMHPEKSLLMPVIKITPEAQELIEHSRCSPTNLCRYSCYDESLSWRIRGKIEALRSAFGKVFLTYGTLNVADFENLTKDFHVGLAWLLFINGKKRDFWLVQLTGYSITKGNKEFIERLEWHGFKANRLSDVALKEFEREAREHKDREFNRYVASLKKPREYNIEEC